MALTKWPTNLNDYILGMTGHFFNGFFDSWA